ncbi:MAG TPA: ABC transporter substrate-binding protein [Candidatus Acidoferrales bacterium]|nr:ABC transporter substrate-binding protein [Candidatus Acidoferrales bacterium]
MTRRAVAIAFWSMLLATCPVAEAQQQKPLRIGVLLPGGPLHAIVDGLKDGLKELGLEEGKQFTLSIQDTKSDTKAAAEAARAFEREKVNLIYALTSPVIAAAKGATQSVPIVFTIGSDPVAMKLVDDFAKPGGRLTGVHYLARDLTAKRLEILKEILPKLSRVMTFYDPSHRVAAEGASLAREEAKRLGLRFIERHVGSAEELRKAVQELKEKEADAFFYTADVIVISQAQLIIDTAKARKMPTMFHEQSLVAKGALASYGQNYHEIGRVSAKYVQQVLKGIPPKDLKIETVDNVDLAINLQTAKQLGLTVPAQVLARASKVIK